MLEPVRLSKLRSHFKKAYLLEDDQVEIMIESSSKSMIRVLEDGNDVIEILKGSASGLVKNNEDQCRKVFHSLKGLLLNMGESEWAAYAKDLEAEYKNLNYKQVQNSIEELKTGMAEVVGYCSDS